jgi:hypothetical protein
MMTPREFNDRVAGDGIGIKANEIKTMIRIPQRAEAQHMHHRRYRSGQDYDHAPKFFVR